MQLKYINHFKNLIKIKKILSKTEHNSIIPRKIESIPAQLGFLNLQKKDDMMRSQIGKRDLSSGMSEL